MIKINVRYIILFCFTIFGVASSYSGDLKFAFYYDGYWGDWTDFSSFKIYGSYNGFSINYFEDHPSEYFFSFDIDNRTPPTKDEIKKHRKSNSWWEYTGTVEYYVCDVYPTFKDCIKYFKRPLQKRDIESEEYKNKLSMLRASYLSKGKTFVPIGYRKITSKATIKIAPYINKDLPFPRVYNLWFDGIGMGIDMYLTFFRNSL